MLPGRNFFISFNDLNAFFQTIGCAARVAFAVSEMACCRGEFGGNAGRRGFPADAARVHGCWKSLVEEAGFRDARQILGAG
jgi:hypothetical protein